MKRGICLGTLPKDSTEILNFLPYLASFFPPLFILDIYMDYQINSSLHHGSSLFVVVHLQCTILGNNLSICKRVLTFNLA